MQRTITTQKLFRFQCDILVREEYKVVYRKEMFIMIDKNEISKLLIDAKTNLVEQIRLMGKLRN